MGKISLYCYYILLTMERAIQSHRFHHQHDDAVSTVGFSLEKYDFV
jgi:hypothetical protein